MKLAESSIVNRIVSRLRFAREARLPIARDPGACLSGNAALRGLSVPATGPAPHTDRPGTRPSDSADSGRSPSIAQRPGRRGSVRPIAGGRQQQGVGARRAACYLPGSGCRGSVMPKRTGQLTLTDIRRRYDAERLLGCRFRTRSLATAWEQAFPKSTANHACAQNLAHRLLSWYYKRFPDDWKALYDPERQHRRPRRFKPRSESERVGAAIIFFYVVFRSSLQKCWRTAVPDSPANDNSARILAQRYANRLIRKYPNAPRQIIEGAAQRWADAFPDDQESRQNSR